MLCFVKLFIFIESFMSFVGFLDDEIFVCFCIEIRKVFIFILLILFFVMWNKVSMNYFLKVVFI